MFEKKLMTEYFPDFIRENVTEVQKAKRVSVMMNSRRPTPRCIIMKIAKLNTKM